MQDSPVQMTKLESSQLSEVGHDPELSLLYIRFRDGHLYRYFHVSRAAYDALRKSESPGKFFHQKIRPVFEYEKVCPRQPPDKEMA